MAGCTMRGDRFSDLLNYIEHQHQAYIFAEKSPYKIEIKKKLEGLIHDFLCIAPHKRKFSSPATEEVLHRSVTSKSDFTAPRATVAWTAIANYADNLLTQPWRKEYHEIKTYCGYYKHHVWSGLVGAELMLEAMGYKHTSQSTLVIDGTLDLKRVNIISLDALIAQVECQIIGKIYAEVLKSVQSCSWVDVLRFRENNVCYPEEAIQAITYRLHQRIHGDTYRTHADNCTMMAGYPAPAPYPYPYMPTTCYNYNYGQPRYLDLMSMPQPQPPHYLIKPHEQYAPPYTSYHQPHPHTHAHMPLKNGYASPMCSSVPTAQLIEFDHPTHPTTTHRRSSSDHRIDTTDYHRNNGSDRYQSDVYSRSTTSDDISSSKRYQSDMYSRSTTSDDISSTKRTVPKLARENWAYKDPEERREKIRTEPPPDLEDAMKTFSLDDSHQITLSDRKSTSKIRDYEEKKEPMPVSNRTSIYDNAPLPQSYNTKQQPDRDKKPSESSTLKSNNLTAADTRKLRVNLTNDDWTNKRVNEGASSKWECKSCTFHNVGSRDVCEICSKSRVGGSSEPRPLAPGGKQCEACTLINEVGVAACKACNRSLIDSGIYV
ncbi:uncharacterized protein LOC111057183 isoform X1 [Nilaparvata lugens]|uniref:uncharacterized protein LOC111057183 isoform X1 n=1 Tax=Nilaparvata lugens TaxID=108931 RepID=UPI00193E4ACA|nr:uncharacterized protein LOC111057183 isoform X1 [Nilaparvata lugens]